MIYSLIRPALFCMNPELAHKLALRALTYVPQRCFPQPIAQPVQAFGLDFSHPIGLAAGLDKNGDYPKPRLFRLPKAQAIINRMGFNNNGVDALLDNVRKAQFNGILGINIGKNKDTPLNQAVDDYLYCLNKVYLDATYVTVNISSPNTPDLRQLQQGQYFIDLMSELREAQLHLADKHQRYVPLVIKLSPDEDEDTLKKMAEVIVSQGIDGIIATNTTCARSDVQGLQHSEEVGGLSGKPLASRATHCLRVLKQIVGDEVTLIGCGGIDSETVAREKIAAGATLLQVYTGLIYQGPGLVAQLLGTKSS